MQDAPGQGGLLHWRRVQKVRGSDEYTAGAEDSEHRRPVRKHLKALDRLNRLAAAPAGSGIDAHRLLEAAPTPTLWTMSSPRGVSETILRRMMFALELRRPTPQVRARIWTRELARHGIEAPDEDVLSLAREFEATPGVGAGATAAAGLAGGGTDTVRHGVRSLSRVLGCERPPQGPPPKFDLGPIGFRP